jgi:uncharacterized protein with GYD domain
VETYVVLATFTPQGSRLAASKAGEGHLDELRTNAGRLGAEVRGFFLTLGVHDLVAIIDAPNERVMAKLALAIGAAGNLRTLTLPALSLAQLTPLAEPR